MACHLIYVSKHLFFSSIFLSLFFLLFLFSGFRSGPVINAADSKVFLNTKDLVFSF
jgi:hypothetical protein